MEAVLRHEDPPKAKTAAPKGEQHQQGPAEPRHKPGKPRLRHRISETIEHLRPFPSED